MGRPQIKEVDYHDFVAQLRKATDKRGRIEKKEKEKWTAYVKQHQVLEPSCYAYARSYGNAAKPLAVIIECGGTWDGYYVYSDDDMFCLKFIPGDPPAAAPTAEPAAEPPASADETAAAEPAAAELEAPAEAPASDAARAAEAPAETPVPAAEEPAETTPEPGTDAG